MVNTSEYNFTVMKTILASLSLSLSLTLGIGSVSAQTVSSSLNNSATVVGACSIVTTQHIMFGQFNPLTDDEKTASGAIQVECTKGDYSISLNQGQNSLRLSNGYEYEKCGPNNICTYYLYKCDRAMKNSGGVKIAYQIFSDASMSSEMNAQGRSTSSVPGTQSCTSNSVLSSLTFNTAGAQTVAVYGKMLGNRNATPGAYVDTMSATVTF